MARNSADVIAAYYGALKIGAALTGLDTFCREAEIGHQLTHSNASLALVDPEYEKLVDAALPAGAAQLIYGFEIDGLLADVPDTEPEVQLDENDIALIIYTSGTEATSKAVLIPHRCPSATTAAADLRCR